MKKFCRSTAYDYVGHNENILQKPKDIHIYIYIPFVNIIVSRPLVIW